MLKRLSLMSKIRMNTKPHLITHNMDAKGMDSDQISATEAYALKYLMSWYRTTTVDIRTLCEVLHIDNIESMPRSVYPYFYSFLLTQHAADTFFTQIEPELRLAHARIGALQD